MVKNGQKPFCRPTLMTSSEMTNGPGPVADDEEYGDGCCSEELVMMIRRCWAEDPADRPDFHSLKTIIKRINKSVDFLVRWFYRLLFPGCPLKAT